MQTKATNDESKSNWWKKAETYDIQAAGLSRHQCDRKLNEMVSPFKMYP